MKGLKQLNTIALGIPIFIAFFAIFERGIIVLALLSTMITGAIQITIGFKFWLENPKNIHIKIYLISVVVFFLLWFLFPNWDWIWFIPAILCLYLSILIYTYEIK